MRTNIPFEARIIFGIVDNKVSERLLQETELDLTKTLDICRATEMSQAQVKAVDDLNSAGVNVHQEKTLMTSALQLRYPCRFCGRRHNGKREAFPAWGKKCNRCGKDNDFAQKFSLISNSNQVSVLEELEDYPVFQVFKVSTSHSSDLNLVTLKVASGSFILFEIDTGARCNDLPAHIYKKATGDYSLKAIVSYGGGSIPVLGTVKLKMQRGSFMSLLLCHLMESKHCRPILGKTACERMGVVEIKDSDTIKRPDTSPKILSKDQVIAMFPDVFDDGIGVLQGECHIRHDGSVKPVQHAP